MGSWLESVRYAPGDRELRGWFDQRGGHRKRRKIGDSRAEEEERLGGRAVLGLLLKLQGDGFGDEVHGVVLLHKVVLGLAVGPVLITRPTSTEWHLSHKEHAHIWRLWVSVIARCCLRVQEDGVDLDGGLERRVFSHTGVVAHVA